MSRYHEQDATQHFVGKRLAGFLAKPFLVSDLMNATIDAAKLDEPNHRISWAHMLKFCGRSFLASCALVLMIGVSAHLASANDGYVIKNVTTVDGVHGARRDMDVVVIGDTIAAVGQNAANAVSHRTLPVIDGNGNYLIPGLWDAHRGSCAFVGCCDGGCRVGAARYAAFTQS